MEATIDWNSNQVTLDYTVLGVGIYAYHNVLPESLDIINRVESTLAKEGTRFNWRPAGLNFGHYDNNVRKCHDFKIKPGDTLGPKDQYSEDMYLLHDQIIDSLKMCISHYKNENYLASIEFFECINIVKYGAGEYFKVHTDDGDPYRCTLSAVGYPNDNYAGGELWFPKFDVKYKPKAGDFVLCPSTYVYAHSSEPVTDEGIKYSLVIMTDRNEFAHRNDSPMLYPKEYREKFGVHG
jgi:hypothetical protein